MSARAQGMDLDGLERPDLNVLFFRVSFDLGFAIEGHWLALTKALAEKKKKELLFEFLHSRSKKWVDAHINELSERDYQQHLEYIRGHILVEKAGLPDGLLHQVYDNIARDLSGMVPSSLAEKLKCMCDGTHLLVSQAVELFGGPRAVARWQRCYPALLVFRHNEPNATRCSFVRGPDDIITVHIGNHLKSDRDQSKGALRTYCNMPFYFFHEYLSHSFSCWQNREFTEGYLVYAAKMMFYRITRDMVRHLFIKDTFDGASNDRAWCAENVAEFYFTAGDKFFRFLLEWAADDGYEGDEADLLALYGVSQMCAMGNKANTDDVLSAFDQKDSQSTRDRLRSIANEAAGIDRYMPRLQ